MPDSFRVVALVSAYNEADIIAKVIEHLADNGVEAYILDNRSTDDTAAEARRFIGRGVIDVEVFPAEGDPRYAGALTRYDWTAILRRKEELAQTLDADWFIHHDADEIRDSPWEGLSLREAFRFVDRLDYNCVDFRVFEFPPVDDGFSRGTDPRTYFTRYREAEHFDQVQVKAWRGHVGPVSLVHWGGHDVEFENKRVFPIPFLLRHYPIRSQAHGRRKVFEDRKNRFAAEERAKSWHIQYDRIVDESHTFLEDPEHLKPFDLRRARLGAMLDHRDVAAHRKAHTASVASLEARLAEARSVVARLEAESRVHVDQIARQTTALDRIEPLTRQAVELGVRVGSTEARLSSVQQALRASEERMTIVLRQRDAIIRERDTIIRDRDATIRERDASIRERDALLGAVSDRAREATDLAAHLHRTQQELAAVYRSRIWRWGEPVGRFIQSMGVMRSRGRTPAPQAAAQPVPSDASDDEHGAASSPGYRLLLVSYYCPTRAHAGGLRILDLYALIRRNCPDVRLDLYTHSRPAVDGPGTEIRSIFDHVYFSPTETLTPNGLRALGCDVRRYDVVDLQFHGVGKHIAEFRAIGRKILFTPMESMVRVLLTNVRAMFGAAEFAGFHDRKKVWLEAAEERRYARDADETICVSKPDARYLAAASLTRRVRAIETGLSPFEFAEALDGNRPMPAADTKDARIVYVAYFGSQTNVMALRWFLDTVHPIIRQRVPDYVLSIVGRGDLSPFDADRDASTEFVGEVADISPYIERARVGIAPAVGGSGFRGKINQYALFGVPTVASPLSAHGLAYADGTDIFVAASPELFATRCVELLTDTALNLRVGRAAHARCLAEYTWQAKWDAIRDAYAIPATATSEAPKVTALVPSYNHARFLERRIQSIAGQSYRNVEIIVIDDRSTDQSDEVLRELQKKYAFTYVRNNRNSGSPFTAWGRVLSMAEGDYIWVCESDDYAEPDFLATAVAALRRTRDAVLFYCNSNVIDDADRRVDTTLSYFHDIWKESRWDSDFVADGLRELVDFQLRGQTVPNMSSALVRRDAFQRAFRRSLTRFRLTGDWLFVGDVMRHGRVVFSSRHLSNFRRHETTSRVRVKSARSQAEFIITKYWLFRAARRPVREFAPLMSTDAIRFLYEPAGLVDLCVALLSVSWVATIRCGTLLALSLLSNREYPTRWFERYGSLKGAR